MNSNLREHLVEKEVKAQSINGMGTLVVNILLTIFATIALIVWGIDGEEIVLVPFIISLVYLAICMPLLFAGLKVLKPNEAYVLTLFGKYYGTLTGPGFYFVNPFVTATSPDKNESTSNTKESKSKKNYSFTASSSSTNSAFAKNKISLKAMTLSNEKQKINDLLGNPIEIGIVVVWRVVNTAKAVFNVDNYEEFLSIQCDSALRNIVRLYPYDISNSKNGDEDSLRGSSKAISKRLTGEIQEKVNVAGLEITEARITHLAYAQEIAAAMLQRQQASAIIDARTMIVEGAVSMVEMALNKLDSKDIVNLDDERKAQMVSNLLVVLCGNKDAQPIVNSGSIY